MLNRRIKLLLSLFGGNVNKNFAIFTTHRGGAARELGNTSKVFQSRIEDRNQKQEEQQVGGMATQFVTAEQCSAGVASFTQALSAAEAGHALGRGDFTIKGPAAFAATIAAQPAPALKNTDRGSCARTAHVLAGATRAG
jgi:hypothetical protein